MSSEEENSENEFVVEKILDKKSTTQGLFYYIKWAGYASEDDTWEHVDNLNCPLLIEEFEKQNKAIKPTKKTKETPAKSAPKVGTKRKKPPQSSDSEFSASEEEAEDSSDTNYSFEISYQISNKLGSTRKRKRVNYYEPDSLSVKSREKVKKCEICKTAGSQIKCSECSKHFHKQCLSKKERKFSNKYCKKYQCICSSCFPECSQCKSNEMEDFLRCARCSVAFHKSCLIDSEEIEDEWECTDCSKYPYDVEQIITFKILDKSSTRTSKSKNRKYYVKWAGKSYRDCSWVPAGWLARVSEQRLRSFTRENTEPAPISELIPATWTTPERVISEKVSKKTKKNKYVVKWQTLPYDQCTWVKEEDLKNESFLIDRYHDRINRVEEKHLKIDKTKEDFSKYEFKTSPQFLKREMYDYQIQGLNWMLYNWWNDQSVILADEMGLGKSIQTIALIATFQQLHQFEHTLLVVPLSTLLNWAREFEVWAPSLNVVTYSGTQESRNLIWEFELEPATKSRKRSRNSSVQPKIFFDVLLTSYEMIITDYSQFAKFNYGCLIVDEGQRLKNKESNLYKKLDSLSSGFRVLLTGTPLQNNLTELYCLMHFLQLKNDAFSSKKGFDLAFGTLDSSEKVKSLHELIRPRILRRLKEKVLIGLPPRAEVAIPCKLTPIQRDFYKAVLMKNSSAITPKRPNSVSLLNVMQTLRNVCNHPYIIPGTEPEPDDTEKEDQIMERLIKTSSKLFLLDKMLAYFKTKKHRILLFSQMTRMLDILEDYIKYKKYTFERIDGKIINTERQSSIDRFNSDEGAFIFLISTRAGRLGLNLAKADTVIIYDSDWNPQNDLQAFSRAHRIGQLNPVLIYRFYCEDTIEENILERANQKLFLEHLVVRKMDNKVQHTELNEIIKKGAVKLFQEPASGSPSETKDDEQQKNMAFYLGFDEEKLAEILDRQKCFEKAKLLTDENKSIDGLGTFNFSDVWKKDSDEKTISNVEESNFWENLIKTRQEEQKLLQEEEIITKKRACTQNVNYKHIDKKVILGSESDSEQSSLEYVTDDSDVSEGAMNSEVSEDEFELDDVADEDFEDRPSGKKPAASRKFKPIPGLSSAPTVPPPPPPGTGKFSVFNTNAPGPSHPIMSAVPSIIPTVPNPLVPNPTPTPPSTWSARPIYTHQNGLSSFLPFSLLGNLPTPPSNSPLIISNLLAPQPIASPLQSSSPLSMTVPNPLLPSYIQPHHPQLQKMPQTPQSPQNQFTSNLFSFSAGKNTPSSFPKPITIHNVVVKPSTTSPSSTSPSKTKNSVPGSAKFRSQTALFRSNVPVQKQTPPQPVASNPLVPFNPYPSTTSDSPLATPGGDTSKDEDVQVLYESSPLPPPRPANDSEVPPLKI